MTEHGSAQQNVGDHGASGAVELLPVAGLPEFRPGDDLAAALAEAAPWLRDDDVVAVSYTHLTLPTILRV